jgi:putative aminopeptidase FrvX
MPDDLLRLLMDLLRLPGISGDESPVAARLRRSWEPLVDELHTDRLGNIIAFRNGVGPHPRPRLLVTAHMDSVGFFVRGTMAGFLLVDSAGRLDPRVLPGQRVTVHGTRQIPGIIVAPPRWCLPEEFAERTVPVEYLLVDLGLTAREIQRVTKVGDSVTFANLPCSLGPDVVCGHSLDNRASLAVITLCLESLAGRDIHWDVVVAATVQEETTYHGAHAAAESVDPRAAVVVDVTYGRGHSDLGSDTFPLAGGPTNAWSPDVHPVMYAAIEAAADRAGVPLTKEVLPVETGTEAGGILVAGPGVPLGLLSVPLRYMHSPREVVHLADIRSTAKVLAELTAELGEDFLERLAQG